ncbi:hypothetical protein L9F63_001395, partial [Diploptera punctata]
SNASTILFVISASVLMRGLPGVDGCNATNLMNTSYEYNFQIWSELIHLEFFVAHV